LVWPIWQGIGSGFWVSCRMRRTTDFQKSEISCDRVCFMVHKNWLSLSAILLSVVILSSGIFRQAEWHPGASGIFPWVIKTIFLWRNRVAAWEGALRIMQRIHGSARAGTSRNRDVEHLLSAVQINRCRGHSTE